jgi:hypothetical protein
MRVISMLPSATEIIYALGPPSRPGLPSILHPDAVPAVPAGRIALIEAGARRR